MQAHTPFRRVGPLKSNIMINLTRPFRSSLLACLFCGASAASLLAQTPADQPPIGSHHHGPPPNVLFDALDANHDGVLSAEEIANAPTVLNGLLKSGETELTRADLRSKDEDEQTPPPRAERAAGHLPDQPADDERTADDGKAASSSAANDPVEQPHGHRRFSMDDQGIPSPWRHPFRHDEDGQPWQRPARAQHGGEGMEGHQRPESDLDGRSEEPRSPRFHHRHWFEAEQDERDGMGSAAEMDEVLATLHRVERELHQLEQKQTVPAPAQP